MTFTQFALDALNERPPSLEHQQHVTYAAMGLAGETADLLDITTEWMGRPGQGPARRLVRKLGYLEHYRALLYVGLERVPDRRASAPANLGRVQDAATALAVQGGRLLLLAKNGVFHEEWADEPLDRTLRQFDEARLAFYREFDFTPDDIWLAHVAARKALQQLVSAYRPAAPRGRRADLHLTTLA